MKKLLLLILAAGSAVTKLNAQCVPVCYNYDAISITYSLFPTAGTNVVSQFSPNPDDGQVNVPIGFNFNFYCNTYTAVNICSNGFIQLDYGVPINFGNPPVSQNSQSFPDPTAPNGLIALNMNDFDMNTSGAVTYTTIGNAPNRMFVVTFSNVPEWFLTPVSNPPLTSGQIVLYETSNLIEIHSATIQTSNVSMTQGIENTTGTVGTNIPGRASSYWSATNDAYRFVPASGPAPTPSISAITNTACSGTTIDFSINSAPGALGYSWSFPNNWVSTSYSSTANTATVGVSGNIQVSVTYTCGTSTPSSFSVTGIPAPVVAITASPQIICSNDQTQIMASGANAVTFTLEPGTLTGANQFTVQPGVTTSYSLYGTDINGCNSINNAQVNIVVDESPTITVSSGSICVGKTYNIEVSGADTYSFSSGFPTVTPPNDGVFTYTVWGMSNVNICVSEPMVSTVTVAPSPSIVLTANQQTICSGHSATITAAGADTYTWNNGPSTSTYAVTPPLSTSYKVTGTSVDGCVKSASITIAVSPCTGIEENTADANRIAVYPNPSNGEFTIDVVEETKIEIYDIQGKLIFKKDLPEGKHAINMSPANSGQYFLKASSSNAIRSAVLIKE